MTGIVSKLFGGGGSGSDNSAQIAAQLALQGAAQRQSLAASINSEADAAQDIAKGSRVRGGRKLLTYLGGGDDGTLG